MVVCISSLYSKISIGNRDWYFIRETGEFDGTSVNFVDKGPILAYENTNLINENPASNTMVADREE
jgi:hypothetical protein